MNTGHYSVMLPEVLGLLAPRAGSRLLDCTFGGGGHSGALLEAADQVSVVALDRDPQARLRAESLTVRFGSRFTLVDSDFGRLGELSLGLFDGILFDLGVSSYQLDETERGFSFRSDAPADMRMDPRQGQPASLWLETADEERIAYSIREYGEERHWRRIVRSILDARGSGLLARTGSLAQLISDSIPARDRALSRIHPATRAFQGIRIAINDELGSIERALPAAFEALKPGGVLCVISFHSLEDRIVKQLFRRWCGMPESSEDSRYQDERVRLAEALTRRPLTPGDTELADNARSRSAKLRALRKL
jgi:16S rRNA (cytosine1402-N4)-methyltransferase